MGKTPLPLTGGSKMLPRREDLERMPFSFFAQGKRGRGGAPTWAVSGTIVDSGATPVSGVLVTLTGDADDTHTTDGTGTYSFDLPDGNYTITPTKASETFTPVSTAVVVDGAAEVADFEQDVSVLLLPFGYSFTGQTIGQPFDSDWADQAQGYAPIIADGNGLIGYQPNRTVGHWRSDAGVGPDACEAILTLPGPIDISGGFKLKFWEWDQQPKEDVSRFTFLDANGDWVVYIGHTPIGNREYRTYFYNDGQVSVGSAIAGSQTPSSHNDWYYTQMEVKMDTETVVAFTGHWSNDFHKGSGTQNFDFDGSLWIPNLVTHIRVHSTSVNIWGDDRWIAGFWIGNNSDTYPTQPVST